VNLGLDTGVFCYQKGLISSVKRPTIRIVGRLDPVKGHEKFFHYFRNLLHIWDSSLPLPFLEIIGEPANLSVEHLLSKANSLGLIQGEHFQIIGTRLKDLPKKLAQTHVGVICSEGSEVICRVAEEFLLCGTPVFVSGVGSLEDCIYSSDAGVSYKKLNTDDTVQKLKGLLLTSFHESEADKERRSIESASLYSKDAMGRSLSNYIEKYCVS
jgi:glycosyltransferase involved in cell wall biosynthesis